MIKICHFVNLITGKSDGVFKHIKSIFTATDNTKYQHILIFQGGEPVERKLRELKIKFYIVSSLNKKYSFKTFYDFYRIIKKENPDILHTHLLKSYSIVGLLNIYFQKKMIFNYHGLFINNNYNTAFQKIIYFISHFLITLYNSVNMVIVPSNNSKILLLNETKRFNKIKTYYNGFTSDRIYLPDQNLLDEIVLLKKNYFVVAVVARSEKQKRIDKGLEILKELLLKKYKVFFVFFGDGPLERENKALSVALGVDQSCKFFGYVGNVLIYMKYFDLLLLTSDWEGFPLTIWEAMSEGVPILSSDVGGIKEIIESENCGIVYDKNDLSAAVENIINLIHDPDRLNLLSSNGKIAIQSKFNENNFAESVEKFYEEINEN